MDSNKKCQKCHVSCSSCTGPFFANCTTTLPATAAGSTYTLIIPNSLKYLITDSRWTDKYMGSAAFCYDNVWSSSGSLTKALQGCPYSQVNFKLSTIANRGEKLLLTSIVLGLLSVTDPVSSDFFTPLTLNNHFLTQNYWGEVVGFSVL